MVEDILDLEAIASELEPSSTDRKEWMGLAMKYAEEFLESLQDKKAYNPDYTSLAEFDTYDLAVNKKELPEILDFLDKKVDSIGINPASPGHLGYIPGGGIFTSAIGDYLAAIFNKYAGLYYGSPGAVKLENKLLRWTADLIGYPEEALGNITSGGSIANLIAVTTARDAQNITPHMISKSVIYYTQQTHHCVNKAVAIAGLGHCLQRKIKVDDRFRMDPVDLENRIKEDLSNGLKPFFVAASTGSTDTGAADPLDQIADITEKYNCWFHLDAAYGGFFIMVDELKHLFKGIERTDSVVLDPHKTLFMPYGIGIILVKNGQALYKKEAYMANYLQDAYDGSEEISPCELSPELTKHFRGLRMWIPLEMHGIAPFASALKEKWLLTKYFYARVLELGFEVGPIPDLSVCIYRYLPENGDANTFNKRLIKAIQNDGRIFISSTNIASIFWLRIAVVCFRTHLKQIDLFLGILEEKKNALLTRVMGEF